MLIKKIKQAFGVETNAELSEILKVKIDTLSLWRRKERSNPPWPLPYNIQGLLSLILKQQAKIQELEAEIEKLKSNKNTKEIK